jgi:hypothetical protein
MMASSMELDQYTVTELKAMFTKRSGLNMMNHVTLQDLEDAKRRICTQLVQTNADPEEVEQMKEFLDKAIHKIMGTIVTGDIKPNSVMVKNVVRDNLNVDYKNSIHRLILIDSKYRPKLTSDPAPIYSFWLNEKVVNVVSLKISNLQIPYTFYNIEASQNNNRLNMTLNGVTTTLSLPDGHYADMATAWLTALNALSPAALQFTYTAVTGKFTVRNLNVTYPVTLNFLPDPATRVNNCLGWWLGFRPTTVGADEGLSTSTFQITLAANNATMTAPAVALLPCLRYFVVVVDDFAKNQTTDTCVQIKLDQETIHPTSYSHTEDTKYLKYLTPTNYNSYASAMGTERTLTKKQLYTRAQQNVAQLNLSLVNTRLEVNAPDQVLGVFAFDGSADWGGVYLIDKCEYVREYHGPITLERFEVRIYDDKGNLVNFNGNDWHMTLMTENVYKY